MMKNLWVTIVCGGVILGMPEVIRAQNLDGADETLVQQYREEAEKAADDMLQSFQGSVKPRYQMAYDDYLYDLQIIAKTGQAPDNEALYNDLRLMRDNQTFVYTKSQEEY